MGSPRVFQTAPPQPASKARMTCSPQLVGGPEASQKGFGQWMRPAKVVERSGMNALRTVAQTLVSAASTLVSTPGCPSVSVVGQAGKECRHECRHGRQEC